MKKEETISITKDFAKNMEELGAGSIDEITIYNRENNKVFFRAGSQFKFHVTEEELKQIKLN